MHCRVSIIGRCCPASPLPRYPQEPENTVRNEVMTSFQTQVQGIIKGGARIHRVGAHFTLDTGAMLQFISCVHESTVPQKREIHVAAVRNIHPSDRVTMAFIEQSNGGEITDMLHGIHLGRSYSWQCGEVRQDFCT